MIRGLVGRYVGEIFGGLNYLLVERGELYVQMDILLSWHGSRFSSRCMISCHGREMKD